MNVLFLCTGNSCRSIMAEAILKNMAPEHFNVQSAGSNPTGFVHPKALETLQMHHIATNGLASKSWDNLNPLPDIIITLCASAQGETCPSYFGNALSVHWDMEDPANNENPDKAFKQCFNILKMRIGKLLDVPLDTINNKALGEHLASIAKSL